MYKKIAVIIVIVILSLLIFILSNKGFYYKSNLMIGNDRIYRFQYHGLFGWCKGLEEVKLFEDESYEYYVTYYCYGDGFFIKHNGEYLKLDEALKKELITPDELQNSSILRKREKEININ